MRLRKHHSTCTAHISNCWLMCLIKRFLFRQFKFLYSILLLCTALALNSISASQKKKKSTGESSSPSCSGLLLNSTPVLPESPSLFHKCVNENDWRQTGAEQQLRTAGRASMHMKYMCQWNHDIFFNYHNFILFLIAKWFYCLILNVSQIVRC